MTKNERIILFLLASLNFTHILDFMIMMPLGNYLMPHFNISARQFSYLVAAYPITAFFSSFIAAFFADRFDRKRILLFAYIPFLAGTLACGFAPSYETLLFARIFTGIFGGLIGAQVMSIVADLFDYEKRGAATGAVMSSFAIASTIGVPFALYLSNIFTWHAPFLLIGFLGIVLVPFLVKYIPPMAGHVQESKEHQRWMKALYDVLDSRSQMLALLFSLLVMTGHFLIIPFVNPYLEFNKGFSKEQTPLIYLVGGIAAFFSAIFLGRIADKVGKLTVFSITIFLSFFGSTPDSGWTQFWDSPRYSSGFASLWHSFAFVPETHMLKSYDQRVRSTYALMQCFIEFTSSYSETIKNLRDQTKTAVKSATEFPVKWKHDRSGFATITYKGYMASRIASEISGLPRLYYDRSKPFEKQIPYYNFYKPDRTIITPKAYIIPQGWWKVIELLKLNKVQMQPLKNDTTILVEAYRIDDYKTSPRQFEMHHLNSDVVVSIIKQQVKFRKGDWYIPLNQVANRFLTETLEPMAEDSYFAWNFFDSILGQKEGFSGYAFEPIAVEYLQTHPELKAKLDQRKATDTTFAKSANAQLNFIYQNSPFYELSYLKYPVYRLLR